MLLVHRNAWVATVLAAAWLSLCVDTSVQAQSQPADAFKARVQPVLDQYCVGCHSAAEAAAGIAFDRFENQAQAIAGGSVWQRALDALETRIMPPETSDQPTRDEIAGVVRWVEKDFLEAQRKLARPPARVGIRRLNRQEYNNTIRDLVGLDLRPADDFPADESAFGFDHIGAAQSLSTIHIEKFLTAAESVLQKAIVTPDSKSFRSTRLLGPRDDDDEKVDTRPLTASAPLAIEHTFPAAGRYLVEFELVVPGEAAAPLVAAEIGEKRIIEPIDGNSESATYRVWLAAAEGKQTVSLALAKAADKPAEFTVRSLVLRGPYAPEAQSLPASHRQIVTAVPEANDASRLESARQVIGRFAQRAFRRPLKAGEAERLVEVFLLADRRGESFERSIQIALGLALVSPQFLFIVEPESQREDSRLNDFELASRLSYFLWSSMPDDELFAQAQQATLRANLRAQARRMLADPKAQAFINNFTGQWLHTRRLDAVTPDREQFPSWGPKLREAMRQETEQFFGHIARNDRSVLELLDADYTFLNRQLAEHYQIPGIEQDEFVRVALDGKQRGGLLTQAAVLTITSNPNRTSPVRRGQWILEQILGTPPPPPPPNVENLDESRAAAAAGSLRERVEIHRSKAACAACHKRMDPLGFALENYDAVGRWRTTDGEFAIEPAGKLTDGRSFDDSRELKQLLKADPKRFARTLIRNMLTYALGRGLDDADWVTIEDIRSQVVQNDYRFSSLLFGIIESEAFQTRGTARQE